MIPAEAVEAAAKAIAEHEGYGWLSKPANVHQEKALKSLEAAAPHILGCNDALWAEFQAATQQAGSNPSAVIRGMVREWVDKNKETDHE